MEIRQKKIAFVIGMFPSISSWMVNQVADLMDRGFEIDIYAFETGDHIYASDRYKNHNMSSVTRYIGMPKNRFVRIIKAIPKIFRLLFVSPVALARVFDIKKYGKDALSLKLLFWSEPFAGRSYDLIHLHEGHIADRFLDIKDILGISSKLITSLYGYDISAFIRRHGPDTYSRLKRDTSAFIVMSNNMKERVIALGFDEKKLNVLPISIDVNSYPFSVRTLDPGETVQLVSVGRFVEKKGFDDLLRALVIVKNKTKKKFFCSIIGDGPLGSMLHDMTRRLGLEDVILFKGYMKIEEIIKYFQNMHIYLQPSKTASNGDME